MKLPHNKGVLKVITYDMVADRFTRNEYPYIESYIESSDGWTYFMTEWSEYTIYVKYMSLENRMLINVEIYSDRVKVKKDYIVDEIKNMLCDLWFEDKVSLI